MSVNTVVLSGRLGDDPKFFNSKNNSTIATFSVAVSDNYKDQRGEWQDRTYWIKASAFSSYIVEKVQNLHKGYQVFIQGKLTSSSFIDKNTNQNRQSVDVQIESLTILDFGKTKDIAQNNSMNQQQFNQQNQYQHNQNQMQQGQQQYEQNGYHQNQMPQRSYNPQNQNNNFDSDMPF
ncbi:single-stranded DNA-binding protein [Succinivibrio sp.]|uniref:single-stranded DNA-binding protein n=1 Tax=Succinivibrio sp. TaxID=2053619 RepID=UPI0026008B2A|nr:single-stranded DNA-binding protein [Succinivibrio sp.]MBQ9220420.1 single-stranded DNA-binding protein [Succinivibrio sp.]